MIESGNVSNNVQLGQSGGKFSRSSTENTIIFLPLYKKH